MSSTATIADLTGDAVLYRDLEPCDPALPRIAALRAKLGMADGPLPRKRDRAYAQLILALAHAAQAVRGGPPLTCVAVIGDTDNDRLLAIHLDELGALAAYGFIGEDRPVAPETMEWQGKVALATRWHLLDAWAATLETQGCDWSRTALLIDIDKTLLGPRGRSDGAIDDARAEGALAVAATLAGPGLDVAAFRRTYAELCHRQWHSFTLDNQDYVVATALLAVAGALDLEQLATQVAAGPPPRFAETLAATAPVVPPWLADLHADLRERVASGDPTPFKAFRRAELTATLARMADGRLTLCDVVLELGQRLAARGALCLAASDKPAESALPSPEQQAVGMRPLHRMPAIIG
ncbi:MAG: hypothetical protein AB4911_18860 [Oscillochloridaceae bacterium umkhey_bin13]